MKPDEFVMPFGKFKGQTLDAIASTDEGLLYLDWGVGEFDTGPVLTALKLYLKEPGIQRSIQAAMDRKKRPQEKRGWHGDKGWWSK